MMSRYTAKTYGREIPLSLKSEEEQFDDLFGKKKSYNGSHKTQEHSVDDPFSFSDEDDSFLTLKKTKPVGYGKPMEKDVSKKDSSKTYARSYKAKNFKGGMQKTDASDGLKINKKAGCKVESAGVPAIDKTDLHTLSTQSATALHVEPITVLANSPPRPVSPCSAIDGDAEFQPDSSDEDIIFNPSPRKIREKAGQSPKKTEAIVGSVKDIKSDSLLTVSKLSNTHTKQKLKTDEKHSADTAAYEFSNNDQKSSDKNHGANKRKRIQPQLDTDPSIKNFEADAVKNSADGATRTTCESKPETSSGFVKKVQPVKSHSFPISAVVKQTSKSFKAEDTDSKMPDWKKKAMEALDRTKATLESTENSPYIIKDTLSSDSDSSLPEVVDPDEPPWKRKAREALSRTEKTIASAESENRAWEEETDVYSAQLLQKEEELDKILGPVKRTVYGTIKTKNLDVKKKTVTKSPAKVPYSFDPEWKPSVKPSTTRSLPVTPQKSETEGRTRAKESVAKAVAAEAESSDEDDFLPWKKTVQSASSSSSQPVSTKTVTPQRIFKSRSASENELQLTRSREKTENSDDEDGIPGWKKRSRQPYRKVLSYSKFRQKTEEPKDKPVDDGGPIRKTKKKGLVSAKEKYTKPQTTILDITEEDAKGDGETKSDHGYEFSIDKSSPIKPFSRKRKLSDELHLENQRLVAEQHAYSKSPLRSRTPHPSQIHEIHFYRDSDSSPEPEETPSKGRRNLFSTMSSMEVHIYNDSDNNGDEGNSDVQTSGYSSMGVSQLQKKAQTSDAEIGVINSNEEGSQQCDDSSAHVCSKPTNNEDSSLLRKPVRTYGRSSPVTKPPITKATSLPVTKSDVEAKQYGFLHDWVGLASPKKATETAHNITFADSLEKPISQSSDRGNSISFLSPLSDKNENKLSTVPVEPKPSTSYGGELSNFEAEWEQAAKSLEQIEESQFIPEERKGRFFSKNRDKHGSTKELKKRIFTSPVKSSTNKIAYSAKRFFSNNEHDSDEEGDEDSEKTEENVDGHTGSEPIAMVREVKWPTRMHERATVSVKVPKHKKELFTVVRNVMQAHQCHEIGETQEYNDDIQYLLESIQPTASVMSRALSTISLASKCVIPSFRSHLRCHDIVPKIFASLEDALCDPSLALATATMMFMLSRDRLSMDLDSATLQRMLQLLEADTREFSSKSKSVLSSYERNLAKVKELCQQLKDTGSSKYLDLDKISTGYLAMETLLSLTSRKAGEWFKEELRTLGGLDHIVQTVSSCTNFLDDVSELTDLQIEKLNKIDRCLRVLENVTFMNSDNQKYLIAFEQNLLISSLVRVLDICQKMMEIYSVGDVDSQNSQYKGSTGSIVFEGLLSTLRVLLNITHDNDTGSIVVGQQEGLIRMVVLCILRVAQHVPTDKCFDMLVLSLGLLINMVEHCDANRKTLVAIGSLSSYDSPSDVGAVSAIEALVQMFLSRQRAAKKHDDESYNQLPGEEADGSEEFLSLGEDEELPSSQENDDPWTKALHKAGKHMEDSIIASYVALLLGCVMQDHSENIDLVREYMPPEELSSMAQILKKFLGFMNLTEAVDNKGGKKIARIIEVIEHACT